MESRDRKPLKQPPSNRNPWRIVWGFSAFVFVGWVAIFIQGSISREAVEVRLLARAEQFARSFNPAILSSRKAGTFALCVTDSLGMGYSVFDSAGISVCSSSSQAWPFSRRSSEVEIALRGKPAFIEGEDDFGMSELALTYPLPSPSQPIGAVRISQLLSHVKSIQWNTRLKIGWVGLTFILFSLVMNLLINHPKTRSTHA